MQNDIANDKVNCNYEEIISELEQCREDERNSQNQIIQVIITAETVLSLIFGIYSFGKDLRHQSFLFHLSNLVLSATFGYIVSLGISAVLRFHFMRNLEDKLLKTDDAIGKTVHWNNFISSITTKNPKHMYCAYTKMHYLCYSIAAIGSILFGIFITVFQFFLIEEKSVLDYLGILFLLVFISLSLVIYFMSSIKAKKMYEKAMEISLKEQNKRIKKISILNMNAATINKKKKKGIREVLKVIGYFIYPSITVSN